MPPTVEGKLLPGGHDKVMQHSCGAPWSGEVMGVSAAAATTGGRLRKRKIKHAKPKNSRS